MVFNRSDHATFVAADPPRHSWLALWGDNLAQLDGNDESSTLEGRPVADRTPLEITTLAGGDVGTRKVLARRLNIADAIDALVDLPATAETSPSVRAWATAAKVAVDLIARGLIQPSVSDAGLDTWAIGRRASSDDEIRAQLAAALPAEAFAVPSNGSSPIEVPRPDRVLDAFTTAIADALPRTVAAEKVTGAAAFAGDRSTELDDPTADWVRTLIPRRSKVAITLRVEPPSADTDPTGTNHRQSRTPGVSAPTVDDNSSGFTAEIILRSRASDVEIAAAEYWAAPLDHADELGADAADSILRTLRLGAACWPPLDPVLDQQHPTRLPLDESALRDLLGDAVADLNLAGIDVDWPTRRISQIQLIPIIESGLEPRDVPARRDEIDGADDSEPGRVDPFGDTDPNTAAVGRVQGEAAMTLAGVSQLSWRAAVDGVELTDDELARLMAAEEPLVLLRDRWIRVSDEQLARVDETRILTGSEALAFALGGAVSADDEVIDARVTGPVAELATRLAALDTKPAAEATGFRGELRDYQQRGLTWLAEMTDLGLGGVLADDMGLGKTIQILALHLARPGLGPLLVVCPATLLANWEREAERFAPGIPVRRFHGAERTLDDLADNEIVVATYGLIRRDTELIRSINWGIVVADEAQAVKNPQARTSRQLRKVPAAARFALTGTPVENHLADLWALLDWTTPGLLGPAARFRREVALPIERNRDVARAESFSRMIAPFVLRRRKSDPSIAPELPSKTETDHFVSLTTEQAALYRATADQVMGDVSAASGIARRGLVLKLITELKQICNHPSHFLRDPGPLRNRSGKLDAADELLDVIVDEGEQALVFTQYVEMGDRIERHLTERGIRTLFLHGSVPVGQRHRMVDAFQAGEVDVFVLSLKAGGTGLNLTAATHVIHYDRWWNPAVEDQASDRAWRIGQDRPVQIHRMICEGTLEDRIAAVINNKRALAESIVGGSEAWISELSDTELTELITLTGDHDALTDREEP